MKATLGPAVRLGLAATVVAVVACSAAAAQTVTASALKAAFLYNFVRFTEWPADAARTGPLTICVLGDPAVARELDHTVKAHAIDGRQVAVSRVTVDGLRACHVLYLTGLDRKRSKEIIDELNGEPVLTVSDDDRFAETGGIVRLFVVDSKIRFDINLDASLRAQLRISSRVLSLGKIVKDDVAPR